ncbi:hypothetical protein [Leptospira adleri]|uniref:Uncharacterized protein n=1 Tax=Leptospira adleri TaxID=2023186 RepID=A0ABX4P1K6_9LEPT|nr:hypothetical protein [Leptospira adleri]PJZ62859.1 hypothetical protein CH376_06005 [Leptospira adleri]
MNLTKKQKVLKTIRADKNLLEKAWRKVPEQMIRRFRAEELADYLTCHILPIIEKTDIKDSYVRKAVPKKEIAVA